MRHYGHNRRFFGFTFENVKNIGKVDKWFAISKKAVSVFLLHHEKP